MELRVTKEGCRRSDSARPQNLEPGPLVLACGRTASYVFTHNGPDRIAGKLMRCFFMRGGHSPLLHARRPLAAVEVLPGLRDAEAVAKSLELFETRTDEATFEGFEVWDQARMVIPIPPAPATGDP
jgi:hypothetical protein